MAGSLKRLSTLLVGVLVAAALGNSTSSAADVCGAASVIDADTIKVEGRRFRLDGIDAPATDQSCLEAGGAKWSCGIEARDELSAYIKGRSVCCNDIGADANYRSHRIGRCRIGKENLSKWLVNQGWALDSKSTSRGRYQIYERAALLDQRGMWKGCFVAPVDFRRWNRNSAKFLGPRCPSDAGNIRDQLFPADPDTPPGCSDAIKGKVRPLLVRLIRRSRGTYHTEACADYATTTVKRKKGDRWFCSEEEAVSQDFRRSPNCK